MSKLLRTDLPDDVWLRLNAEAEAHGQKIGAYLKALIVKRDAVRLARFMASQEQNNQG